MPVDDLYSRTHRLKHVDESGAAMSEPDAAYGDVGIRMDTGCHNPEGGGGGIARNHEVDAAQLRLALYRDARALHGDLRSLGGEQALGMVARRRWLLDARDATGKGSRQEQARLHLCAGHGHRVVDPAEISSSNGHWQVA